MDAGIGVNEDSSSCEALRGVTGDRVTVVKMTMVDGVEHDLTVVVEACREPTIGMDRLDGGEVAISNAKRLVGRCELAAVAHREFSLSFAIDALRRASWGHSRPGRRRLSEPSKDSLLDKCDRLFTV